MCNKKEIMSPLIPFLSESLLNPAQEESIWHVIFVLNVKGSMCQEGTRVQSTCLRNLSTGAFPLHLLVRATSVSDTNEFLRNYPQLKVIQTF